MIAAPPIVHDPIPFGTRRIAETRAYAVRHYGLHRARLIAPKVIVEHMTENSSFSATFNTFAPDVADPELHELPATCAHFVIDPGGRIHQLVSLRWICRHTVGLNWTAIGIEHVGFSEAGVLGVVGLATGAVSGAVLSVALVDVLSGVFDPPPEVVAVPWGYLVTLVSVIAVALLAVGAAGVVLARRPATPVLREM